MKKDPAHQSVQQKMETTLALFDASLHIMKQNLRRRHPDETEEQRQERFRLWLHKGTTFEPPEDGGSAEVL